jgi:hypothetical protein
MSSPASSAASIAVIPQRCMDIRSTSDSDNFDQNTLGSHPIEFSVVNLFPWPQVQAPIGDGHGHLMSEQLALEVRISIVFPGSVVAVFGTISAIDTIGGCILFQPIHDVGMKSVFEIIHVDGGGDVHGVDQNQAIGDTRFPNDALNLIGNAADFIALRCIDVNFFGIGHGLTGYFASHAIALSIQA